MIKRFPLNIGNGGESGRVIEGMSEDFTNPKVDIKNKLAPPCMAMRQISCPFSPSHDLVSLHELVSRGWHELSEDTNSNIYPRNNLETQFV